MLVEHSKPMPQGNCLGDYSGFLAVGKALFGDRCRATPGGIQKAIDVLIRQLGSDNLQERERASQELVQIGTPALKALRRTLNNPDPELAVRSKACITTIERNDQISSLIIELKNKRPEKKLQAISRLREFDQDAEKALPILMELLDDEDVKVQVEATGIMEVIGPRAKRAVPRLIIILQNQQLPDDLRFRSSRALGFIGSEAEEAVPALIQLLEAKQPLLRCGAASALHI